MIIATIPKDREITAQLFIGRTDGTTYEDITDYLVNAEVELGDISSVGTGNTGADAVVRTCRFTLQNDENNDFSPRNQNSSWNQFDVDSDGTDEYSPLLYPMREVILRCAIEADKSTFTDTIELVADGTYTYVYWAEATAKDETYVIGDETLVLGDETDSAAAFINAAFNTTESTQDTPKWRYDSSLNEDRETVYLNGSSTANYYIDYDNRKIRFYYSAAATTSDTVELEYDKCVGSTTKYGEILGYNSRGSITLGTFHYPILIGSEKVYVSGEETSNYTINYDTGEITTSETGLITADYTYFDDLFGGYLGDSISTSGQTVSCDARDYAKKLQDYYIDTKRNYGNDDGSVLAEDVINNILDDNGFTLTSLKYHKSTGFAVKEYTLNYKSVWDSIQKISNQFGWFLGYLFDENNKQWRLTLLEPPRTKGSNSADWELDYTDDFYQNDLDIFDSDIRNAIKVIYRDKNTGERKSEVVTNQASIDAFGRRAMQIEEDSASQIDTSSEALDMANAALEDLKDLKAKSNIDMPLLTELKLFDGVNIIDDRVSSTTDFFGVDSIRHKLDFSQGSFRTEFQGSGKVVGGKNKWLKMQTRPGASPPVNPSGIADEEQTMPKPTNLSVESIIKGFAVSFDPPYVHPNRWAESEVHVSTTSGFTPDSSTLKKKGKGSYFEITRGLAEGQTYYVKVIHVSNTGQDSPVSDEISITASGSQISSTLVVAANNSSQKAKAGADYICDGTDDQTEINNAINNLPSGGGKVTLMEGTFLITDEINLNPNVKLEGQGKSTIIKVANNTSYSGTLSMIYLAGNLGEVNAEACNLYLDANDSNNSINVQAVTVDGANTDSVHLLSLKVQDANIRFVNNENITVKKCELNNASIVCGISTQNNTASSFITENTIENSSIAIALTNLDNFTVANNTIINCQYGIQIDKAVNNIITQNNLRNIDRHGIVLGDIDSANDEISSASATDEIIDNEVSKNKIYFVGLETDNTYSCIVTSGGANQNSIQGNLCRHGSGNKTKHAIVLDIKGSSTIYTAKNNLVSSNDFYNSSASGAIQDNGSGNNFGAGNRLDDGTWST